MQECGENATKASGTLPRYKVVGRCLATRKCHTPPLYRLRIFAPDHVVAKSPFWYLVSQLNKMKRSVFEKYSLRVRNFGIWLRYDSRSGTNMYREYRALSPNMGAWAHSPQIMKVEEIAASECRRPLPVTTKRPNTFF
uniref:Uncharacterized protein n=1 Tax=Saimiri boliviensis boliviensis TaxID=39432 RepID=A0A2K6TWD8_SAIBB